MHKALPQDFSCIFRKSWLSWEPRRPEDLCDILDHFELCLKKLSQETELVSDVLDSPGRVGSLSDDGVYFAGTPVACCKVLEELGLLVCLCSPCQQSRVSDGKDSTS